jgi:hypothetical protein
VEAFQNANADPEYNVVVRSVKVNAASTFTAIETKASDLGFTAELLTSSDGSRRRLDSSEEFTVVGTSDIVENVVELLVYLAQTTDPIAPLVNGQVDINVLAADLAIADIVDAIEIANPELVPVQAWKMFSPEGGAKECTKRENPVGHRVGEISTYRSTYDTKFGFLPEFYLPHCTWGQDFTDEGFTTYAIAWLDICEHTFAVDPTMNELDVDGDSQNSIVTDKRLRVGPVAQEYLQDCKTGADPSYTDQVITTLYRCTRYHGAGNAPISDDFLHPINPTNTPYVPTYMYEASLLAKGWKCEHQEFSWDRNIERLPLLESHVLELADQPIYRDYDQQDTDAKIEYEFTLTSDEVDTLTCANLVNETRFGRSATYPVDQFTPTYETDGAGGDQSCERFPEATFLLGWGFKTMIQITDTDLIAGLNEFNKYYNISIDSAFVHAVQRDFADPTFEDLDKYTYAISNSSTPVQLNNPLGDKVGFDGSYFNVQEEDTQAATTDLERVERIVKDKFVLTGKFTDNHIVAAGIPGISVVDDFEAVKIVLNISFVPFHYVDGVPTYYPSSRGDGEGDSTEVDRPDYEGNDQSNAPGDHPGSRRRLRAMPRRLQTSTVLTVTRRAGSTPIEALEIDTRKASVFFGYAEIDPAHYDSPDSGFPVFTHDYPLTWAHTHFADYIHEHTAWNSDFPKLDQSDKAIDETYFTFEPLGAWEKPDGKIGVDYRVRTDALDYELVHKTLTQYSTTNLTDSSDSSIGVTLSGGSHDPDAQNAQDVVDVLHDVSGMATPAPTNEPALSDIEEHAQFGLIIGVTVASVVGVVLLILVINKLRSKANASSESQYAPVPILGPASFDF